MGWVIGMNASFMLKITYFAREFYYAHGGSTHAREFFFALKGMVQVSTANIFPEKCELQSASKQRKTSSRMKHCLDSVLSFVFTLSPCRSQVKALCQSVADTSSDVLIVRAGQNFSMIAEIKKRLPEVLVIAEVNAAIFDETFPNIWFKKFWQEHEARKIGQADGVTVVSSYLKRYLTEHGVPEEKILVNQNGVNPEVFKFTSDLGRVLVRNAFGIPEGAFVVGYVGGMEQFRRLPEIVEHIAALRKAGIDDLFLLLVGDGYDMPAVQTALAENADVMDGWVWCQGRKPYDQIPGIMATFDLAIFPFSNPYGSPIKLFEYLAMGLPVIGPDVPAVRELFTAGTHLLMASQRGADFTEMLQDLKNNPERCRQLASAGQAYVLENFTWQHNATRVFEHIQRCRNANR